MYIGILSFIVIQKYPRNMEDITNMTSNNQLMINNKEFIVVDSAYTENKSSFFWLLEDEKDNTWIMTATKFPLIEKYELLDCKPFYDKEILEKKDFYNDITVVYEDGKLTLQEKVIFPLQYLCIVLPAIVLIIEIFIGFAKK